MSDPTRWARTDEQIARMQAAQSRGSRCAWCGRQPETGCDFVA